MHAAKRFDSDDIVGNLQVHILAEADFERIGGLVGVAAVGQQSALHAFAEARIAGPDAPSFAGLLDDIPQFRASRPVHQIKLESALFRPAGPRHRHGDPLDFRVAKPEVFQSANPLSEYRSDHVLCLGTLHGQWGDIGLADFDLEAALGRDCTRPEPDIGIRDGEPVKIIVPLQQDRIVDQHAGMVAERNIFTLAHPAVIEIARAQ